MPNRLEEVEVHEVSAVKKGANRRRWFLRKQDDEPETEERMDLEEIKRAVAEVVAEIVADLEDRLDAIDSRLDEIEGAQSPEAPVEEAAEKEEEPVEKAVPVEQQPEDGQLAEFLETMNVMKTAIDDIRARLERVEKASGLRKSAEYAPQAESKSFWAGIF